MSLYSIIQLLFVSKNFSNYSPIKRCIQRPSYQELPLLLSHSYQYSPPRTSYCPPDTRQGHKTPTTPASKQETLVLRTYLHLPSSVERLQPKKKVRRTMQTELPGTPSASNLFSSLIFFISSLTSLPTEHSWYPMVSCLPALSCSSQLLLIMRKLAREM